MPKKIVISILISILLFTYSLLPIFTPLAHANGDSTWYDQSFGHWSIKVFDPDNPDEIFGERYTYAQVTWIIHSLTAILLGNELTECIGKLEIVDGNIIRGIDAFRTCVEALSPISYSGGAVMPLASANDFLLNTRLASGVNYLSSSLSRLHIIPKAHAQGFGFTTLDPILTIWKATRNMAYFLLIFAFIAMAFMIMFRVKISPQTIITVQSALPRLVLILILITFSYAIAGLIVDLSYVVVGIMAMLIKTAGTEISELGTIPLFQALLTANPLGSILLALTAYMLVAALIAGGIASILSGGTMILPALGIGLVLMLIIAIVFLIISLRIFWLMLKTVIKIVILIITGPILILLGVFPGAGGVGSWLKSLIANVAVFPVIIVMLFLAHYFFWSFYSSTSIVGNLLSEWSWVNPYEINPGALDLFGASESVLALPGFGARDLDVLGFLLSFGILFLVPSVGNMIQSLISGRPFAYGTAIGEAFGPISWGYGKAMRSAPVSAIREAAGRETAVTILTKAKRYRGPGSGLIDRSLTRLQREQSQLPDVEG